MLAFNKGSVRKGGDEWSMAVMVANIILLWATLGFTHENQAVCLPEVNPFETVNQTTARKPVCKSVKVKVGQEWVDVYESSDGKIYYSPLLEIKNPRLRGQTVQVQHDSIDGHGIVQFEVEESKKTEDLLKILGEKYPGKKIISTLNVAESRLLLRSTHLGDEKKVAQKETVLDFPIALGKTQEIPYTQNDSVLLRALAESPDFPNALQISGELSFELPCTELVASEAEAGFQPVRRKVAIIPPKTPPSLRFSRIRAETTPYNAGDYVAYRSQIKMAEFEENPKKKEKMVAEAIGLLIDSPSEATKFLMKKHGLSRERAIALVLSQIRDEKTGELKPWGSSNVDFIASQLQDGIFEELREKASKHKIYEWEGELVAKGIKHNKTVMKTQEEFKKAAASLDQSEKARDFTLKKALAYIDAIMNEQGAGVRKVQEVFGLTPKRLREIWKTHLHLRHHYGLSLGVRDLPLIEEHDEQIASRAVAALEFIGSRGLFHDKKWHRSLVRFENEMDWRKNPAGDQPPVTRIQAVQLRPEGPPPELSEVFITKPLRLKPISIDVNSPELTERVIRRRIGSEILDRVDGKAGSHSLTIQGTLAPTMIEAEPPSTKKAPKKK